MTSGTELHRRTTVASSVAATSKLVTSSKAGLGVRIDQQLTPAKRSKLHKRLKAAEEPCEQLDDASRSDSLSCIRVAPQIRCGNQLTST